MIADIDGDVSHHWVGIRLAVLHFLHSGRVSAAIYVAIDSGAIIRRIAFDGDIHLIGERTP